MNKTARLWRNFDFILFGTVVVLIIYGVLMIRSATLGAVDTELISRVPRQIQYAIIGIAMMFVFAAIDYRLLAALQPYIYGVLVFLLALVAVLGQVGDGGAQRWLTVGLPVQPSELAKVLIVGTSGIVQPAASLPYLAKQNGGAFLIDVNPERDEITPICNLFLQGTAGGVLPRLVELMDV